MLKKICNILSTLIMVILICIVSILCVPKIMGMETLAVISGSMEPYIPIGSLVIINETSFADLNIGDVVTYRLNDETLVTHRIESINKEKKEVITKGDANESNDGNPISFDRIVGKLMWSVPFLGYLTIYMKTPLGIAIMCGIVFILVLLYFLPSVFEKDE